MTIGEFTLTMEVLLLTTRDTKAFVDIEGVAKDGRGERRLHGYTAREENGVAIGTIKLHDAVENSPRPFRVFLWSVETEATRTAFKLHGILDEDPETNITFTFWR